jgi:hypothetical protein
MLTYKQIVKLIKLEASLPALNTHDGLKKPESFIRNGQLTISAEAGDGFADYYGEYQGGMQYIDPKLEKWAAKKGGYWEWENPGTIVFYKD